MKHITILLALTLTSLHVFSQKDEVAERYAGTITKEDLYDYLSILASDALEGRETGERGQKMAAAFISDHFEDLGLAGPVKDGQHNSYYQQVNLYRTVPGDIYIKANGKRYNNFEDVVFYGASSSEDEVATKVVFAGNGMDVDYENVRTKGNSVLILAKNIQGTKSLIERALKNEASTILISGSKTDAEFKGLAQQFKSWLENGTLSINRPEKSTEGSSVFFVSPSVAGEIFNTPYEKLEKIAETPAKLSKIKPAELTLKSTQEIQQVNTENVLGYLEGTDKKDELIVITAHYDHIGRHNGEINNGADDDGSGTSSVMELAEAFAMAKKDGHGPRRSILVMLVTGEEKGLLGSEFYAENPVFPLENTVTDLNIDMIGRVDPKHADNPDYIYLVGADKLSSELHQISEKINETYTQFELDYTYNDEDHPDRIYYRSDHWNFAKNNIPVIFYFNGVHEDYHKPSDTIDKINFELLTKRAHLVFYTAWVLANRDERIVTDKLPAQEIDKD